MLRGGHSSPVPTPRSVLSPPACAWAGTRCEKQQRVVMEGSCGDVGAGPSSGTLCSDLKAAADLGGPARDGLRGTW